MSKDIRRYTLGFIFSSFGTEVLLMYKTKPEWQANKYNGIGGKIEPGETSLETMVREAREETGLETNPELWVNFGTMVEDDLFFVDLFYYIYYGSSLENMSQVGEDIVGWFDTDFLPQNAISNIKWLVPLALDHYTSGYLNRADILYTGYQ